MYFPLPFLHWTLQTKNATLDENNLYNVYHSQYANVFFLNEAITFPQWISKIDITLRALMFDCSFLNFRDIIQKVSILRNLLYFILLICFIPYNQTNQMYYFWVILLFSFFFFVIFWNTSISISNRALSELYLPWPIYEFHSLSIIFWLLVRYCLMWW